MREKPSCVQVKEPMSKLRKSYMARLVGRCVVFVLCVLVFIFEPQKFDILQGLNFFDGFSVFHLLWAIWIVDMILQLVPVKEHIPLGSQKHMKQRFKPIREKINKKALKAHIQATTKSAYKVFVLWAVLIAGLGILHHMEYITDSHLFLVSAAFYVCDLICVLIWCPFRLMLGNKCCTTCRIFNWDHMMMFTPMVFVAGVYSYSLLALAFAVWVVWELCVAIYPERFWEESNGALKCSECTDKLCTQYCRKLR